MEVSTVAAGETMGMTETRKGWTPMFTRVLNTSLASLFLVSIILLPTNESAGAEKLEKVTVGTVASVSDAGIYVAIAKGFFKEQGLEIDTPVFDSGSNQIALLASGKLDVAGGTLPLPEPSMPSRKGSIFESSPIREPIRRGMDTSLFW